MKPQCVRLVAAAFLLLLAISPRVSAAETPEYHFQEPSERNVVYGRVWIKLHDDASSVVEAKHVFIVNSRGLGRG